MHRYTFVAKRLLQAVPLLVGMTLLTFLILQLVPADPAEAIAGPKATPQLIAQLRDDLGLDRPLVSQYLEFLGGVVQGDLGISWRTELKVSEIVGQRWPVTAWLVGTGLVLTLLISVPLAALAATRRGRVDAAVRIITLFGLGMPSFWVGIMLVVLVAVPTGAFPVGGHFGENPVEHLRAVFLPALALAITTMPVVIRSLRAGLIGALDSDYVSAARALGVSGTTLFLRHVLRNSLVPTVALLGVLAGYLSFGAVVLERTFDLPGVGDAIVRASVDRDYPVVLGLTLLFGLFVVVSRLIADVVIALIDPRVKMS